MIGEGQCPKCKKGSLVFGTFDLYCSENCGHREPHKHGEGPYTCTCGPKFLGVTGMILNDNTSINKLYTDKLDELFKMQKEFQDKYGFWPELHQIASAGASEFLELWAKSSGKWWKKTASPKNEQVEELIDVLHFFLLACLKLEITPQELFDAYCDKLGVNYKRQKDGY